MVGNVEGVLFGIPKKVGTSNIYLQSIWDTKTKTGFICTLETDEDGEFYVPEKKDIKHIAGKLPGGGFDVQIEFM